MVSEGDCVLRKDICNQQKGMVWKEETEECLEIASLELVLL